jgi:hypothetical protein
MTGASKSENLLFAGSVSKKGQAKPALFGGKGEENPLPPVCSVVGAHCVRPLAVNAAEWLRARAARPYENPKAALVFPWF